jgi:hypothetical protein
MIALTEHVYGTNLLRVDAEIFRLMLIWGVFTIDDAHGSGDDFGLNRVAIFGLFMRNLARVTRVRSSFGFLPDCLLDRRQSVALY